MNPTQKQRLLEEFKNKGEILLLIDALEEAHTTIKRLNRENQRLTSQAIKFEKHSCVGGGWDSPKRQEQAKLSDKMMQTVGEITNRQNKKRKVRW